MRPALTRAAVAAALAALIATGGSAYAPTADPVDHLRQDLDAILDAPELADADATVLVQEADGTVLYARDEHERAMPASNAKLFTSAAALEVLGADHRFTTSVLATGRQTGPQLHGDLYLRGGGDPTMLAKDFDALAAKVAAAGIRVVRGRLVADDTWYDDERFGTNWATDDESYYYNAQISALTVSPNEDYDAGTVIVEVRPGATAGSPAEVTVVPETSYVRIDNDATTKASGNTAISVEREHGTNTIVVSGSIPLEANVDRNWATVDDPTGYAADVFRRALARHGVRVKGKTTYAATPASARELAAHRSMTVGELLVPFMKLSNNMHAEHLVKEMGRKAAGEGTWDAGLDAMFDALESFGVERNRIRLADGSGLSRWDLVSARQVANLLTTAREKPWFRTWYDSLPVAGIDDRWIGGTLRSRMRGTPAEGNVHAKTGTLTGATGLSGYVTDADGEVLVFSVIHNDHIGAVDPKATEDLIAIRLAGFTRNPQSGGTASPRPQLPRTDYGPVDVECSWVKAC